MRSGWRRSDKKLYSYYSGRETMRTFFKIVIAIAVINFIVVNVLTNLGIIKLDNIITDAS